MPIFSVKFHMAQFGQTWNYQWYLDAGDAEDVVSVMGPQSLMVAAIRDVSDPRTLLRYVSVGRAPQPGGGAGVGPPARRKLNLAGRSMTNLTPTPDITGLTGLVEIISTTGATRGMQLRGLPDQGTVRDVNTGAPAPHPVWATEVANLVVTLSQPMPNGGALQVQSTAPPTPPWEWIDVLHLEGVVNTNDRFTQITTIGNHGLARGHRVLARGVDECILAGYKGSFAIADAPTPTTLVVRIPYRSKEVLLSPDNMQIRRELFTYSAMNAALSGFADFTTRDTGSSGWNKRGRARSRSCRRR